MNAYSKMPVMHCLELCASDISHFHIHNNDGSRDTHSSLNQGSIPIKELLQKAELLCPEATVTLELMEAEEAVNWLRVNNQM